jgi:hypothetical protein
LDIAGSIRRYRRERAIGAHWQKRRRSASLKVA